MRRTTADFHFDRFRVDVGNECLWRGEEVLKLTPKAFALLRYLLDHAGQLVTKEALWQERVKAGRWRRYHQQIGERKEAAYRERANKIAAELALHFE